MQPLEVWIRENIALERLDSAHLRYDEMDHQAPLDLAGVYRPYDPGEIYDWVDQTLIFAYLDALATTGRILDIGTGDGWPALSLAPYVEEVVGIDLSKRRVQVARENQARFGYENVTFAVASGEELSFPEGSFDGAVVGTALEQMDDPFRCLAEIHRVLTPGGTLVSTFEHLAAELSEGIEEEVEFFKQGDKFLYRYAVKEVCPPREAEYQVILQPISDLAEFLTKRAELFPSRPGFVRRTGEPGARLLIGEIQCNYGLAFLETAAKAINSGRYFELQHFDIPTLKETLNEAGFTKVEICGRINQLAHHFFIDLHERGKLKQALAPHFATICAAFATLWPLIPPRNEPVLFVRCRRNK